MRATDIARAESFESRWKWNSTHEGMRFTFENPHAHEAYIIVEFMRDGERRIVNGGFSTDNAIVPIGADFEVRRIEIHCGNVIMSKLKPEPGEWYEL